jgi:hypothetical protein
MSLVDAAAPNTFLSKRAVIKKSMFLSKRAGIKMTRIYPPPKTVIFLWCHLTQELQHYSIGHIYSKSGMVDNWSNT